MCLITGSMYSRRGNGQSEENGISIAVAFMSRALDRLIIDVLNLLKIGGYTNIDKSYSSTLR